MHASKIEIHRVNIASLEGRHSIGREPPDFDGALPVVKTDGADQIAGSAAVRYGPYCLVVLASSTPCIQTFRRQEPVSSCQDVGWEVRGRNIVWELRVGRQEQGNG